MMPIPPVEPRLEALGLLPPPPRLLDVSQLMTDGTMPTVAILRGGKRQKIQYSGSGRGNSNVICVMRGSALKQP